MSSEKRPSLGSNFIELGARRGDGHEAEPVHRRTDHRGLARAGSRSEKADLCCKHGISSAIFYKWKAKYGGLQLSDAKRLKALEGENTKLKKFLAEAILDNAMLRTLHQKMVTPPPDVRPSLTFRSPMRSASGGRVRRLEPIAARYGIAAVTGRCGNAGTAARVGIRSPPVRLSTAAHPAQA